MLFQKFKGFLNVKIEIYIKKYTNGSDAMKIGKFGKLNNISIDTIRHYMDLSLIIPEKREGTIF